MDSSGTIKPFARAVLHELFRCKNIYNAIATLLLLIVLVIGFFWPETYLSHFSIDVRASDDRKTGRAVQLLANRLDSPDLIDHYKFLMGDLDSHDYRDGLQSYLQNNISTNISGNLVNYTVLSNDNGEQAFNSALVLSKILMDNGESTDALKALQTNIDALFVKEKDALAKLRELNLQVEFATEKISGDNHKKTKERITNVTKLMDDLDVEINVVDTRLSLLKQKLLKETALQESLAQYNALKVEQQELDEAALLISEQLLELENQLADTKNRKKSEAIKLEIADLLVSAQEYRTEKQILVGKLANYQNAELYDEDPEEEGSLYEQLRKEISLAEVEKHALQSRYDSLQSVLNRERQSAKKGQVQASTVNELKRRQLEAQMNYDDFAQEKALFLDQKKDLRESLDTYKLVKKPTLSKSYEGIGFREFLIAGPVIAIFIPLLVATFVVVIDARIRTVNQLKQCLDGVALMEVIPQYNSPMGLRIIRNTVIGLIAWGIIVICAYIVLGVIGLTN